ncbi:MFS transporter [Chloroflexota bacterium]
MGAATLLMAGFYGAQLSFGVFMIPVLEEFGWTRSITSGAMSTVAGIAGILGIMAGRFSDKYGARILIAIGALFSGSGYLLLSRINSIWELYIYFGLFTGICLASCWSPVNATVSRWFVKKRVLAVGIAISGITIGQILVPPLAAHFIADYGWRFSFTLLAFIVWGTAIPAIIILGRNAPAHAAFPDSGSTAIDKLDIKYSTPVPLQEWSTVRIAKTTPFWTVMVAGFVTAAGFYLVVVHVVAYATDMGISATSAALILTFTGIGNISGRILAWPITIKIGSRIALLLLLALQAIALFAFMWSSSLWIFTILAIIFGVGLGAVTTLRVSMVSEHFGIKSVGKILGLSSISWAAGGITGPILAGYIFDLMHSYDVAFIIGGTIMTLGMIVVYLLKGSDSTIVAQ